MERIAKLNEVIGSTSWKPYVDGFLFDCRVRNLTKTTIDGYAQRLTYLIMWCLSKSIGTDCITHQHIQEYLASIVGKLSVFRFSINRTFGT